MATFLFGVRVTVAVLVLLIDFILMVPFYYLGVRYRGIHLSSWVNMYGVRLLNRILRVRVICDEPEKIRNHRGLILANHQSYLDITSLYTITPTRSLAAAEVLHRPIIGWMAKAVGCIFVERGSIKSARAMREQVAEQLQAEPDPPLIMYPEGKLGVADRLNKFRLGTFRIAIENEVPYLLCGLRYSHPDVTTWHGSAGESMLAAIMRLLRYGKPITVEVIVLDTIAPTADDNPQKLAVASRELIGNGLGINM